ncbi:unnamed protein product, partial [Prorocentrum cordatum]
MDFLLGLPAGVHVAAAASVLCAGHLFSIWLRRPRIKVSGKHVVITGGSQGLGKALALLCVQRGARVTIVARTASKLEEACAEIGQAARTFGRVDVFVANAGTGNGMLIIGSPTAEVQQTLETQVAVNLVGGLRCVIAAAQLMVSDGEGGRVSIVSSVAGLATCPGYAIYSATKFGHRGFLAGAYEEFRRHGVHLSVFYPG